MPKDKPLRVFANPWHAPLDHNHRAQSAVPWDPHHNTGRGWVGAVLRLDDEGEAYYEYEQFDHELAVLPDAKPVELPEYPVNADGIRARSVHYIYAIRSGELLAADKDTHARVFGTDANFVEPLMRLADAQKGRLAQHERDHGEAPEPKPRPKVGEGRQGHALASKRVAMVTPVSGDADTAKRVLARVVTGGKTPAPADGAPKAGG